MSADTAGGSSSPSILTVGDLVEDTEDDDPDPAVVVNRPTVTVDEWTAYDDVTVAEDNPAYPDDARVVCVVYQEDLEDRHPEYDGSDPFPLTQLGPKFYSFPEGRLARCGTYRPEASEDDDVGDDTDADEPVADPPEDLLALADRLRDGADVDVVNGFGESAHLEVEKLGATYQIHADGRFDGDGPHAAPLEDLAEEYLGGDGE